MSAWILIPVFVAGMLTGGALVLMWANHPWTIPEGDEETMEAKTVDYWARKGHTFIRMGDCPACHMPVEFWRTPGGTEAPIDLRTYEAHFSTCSQAKQYRTDQRMEAGIL